MPSTHEVVHASGISCRYNDPPYVKVKKLEVLTELCNVANAQSLVDELGCVQSLVTVSTTTGRENVMLGVAHHRSSTHACMLGS